jgi:hypothetical protein
MSGFKSPGQRKFLFASDKDKTQGQDPLQVHAQKAPATTLPTSHPSQMTQAPQSFALGTLGQAPKFHPPGMGSIQPTSNPNMHLPKPGSPNPTAIPALPGMPRFGRTRKFMK